MVSLFPRRDPANPEMDPISYRSVMENSMGSAKSLFTLGFDRTIEGTIRRVTKLIIEAINSSRAGRGDRHHEILPSDRAGVGARDYTDHRQLAHW